MKLKTPPPRTTAIDALFATVAGLIGLIVRLAPGLSGSFPLNDGGLFYRMILDLQANNFHLPVSTTFNAENIPFAYPPLAFYITGWLSSTFHLDVLTILRILPPIVSALSTPALYFLARKLVKSGQETALAAALAFALIPRGFEWQIMGGGITRAFGFLFSLLTIRAAYILFTDRSWRHFLPTILWGSLTVLTHPEAAAQTLIAVVLLYLVLDRSWKGALSALICGAAILTLSAPWWITVLSRNGFDPFIAVLRAARDGTFVDFPARVFLTFQFNFSEEINLPIIAVLGLIGLFSQLSKREFLLPLLVTVPLFIEPRSAPQFMVIPLAMLAGIGLVDVLLPALKSISASVPRPSMVVVRGILAYFFIYSLFSAYFAGMNIANSVTLQPSDRIAFVWVKENVPPGSRFLILTGGGAVTDPIAEWFPALSDRTSINTIFGLEWIRSISFRNEIENYYSLQGCLDQDLNCLSKWSQETGLDFTHVLIHKGSRQYLLQSSLAASTQYVRVFDNPTTVIYTKAP